ncbi:MAG TPA: class I SAM-dependent methyltransferase [Candidatus Acidoferrum sp.]|nr:class I SAM-dependent methyltransferase [Candidatus Acidoferrum sp.]
MPPNVTEWDARYREAAQNPPAEAADIVSEWLPLLPRGRALDLACGTGRHALLLAAHGLSVTAVDWSGAALDILDKRARKSKISVARVGAAMPESSSRGMHLVQANLEEIGLPETSFSVILCFHYLQRPLFLQIVRALRPGGLLLFETYTREQLNYTGGPRNPAHLLEPGELRTAFPGLRALFYRELNAGQGIASLVAQKPHPNV